MWREAFQIAQSGYELRKHLGSAFATVRVDWLDRRFRVIRVSASNDTDGFISYFQIQCPSTFALGAGCKLPDCHCSNACRTVPDAPG